MMANFVLRAWQVQLDRQVNVIHNVMCSSCTQLLHLAPCHGVYVYFQSHFSLSSGSITRAKESARQSGRNILQGHTVEFQQAWEVQALCMHSNHVLNGKQHKQYLPFMSLSAVQLALSIHCKYKNVSFKKEMCEKSRKPSCLLGSECITYLIYLIM